MAKQRPNYTRIELEDYYLAKFKNLFITKYYIEGLTRFENDFVFGRLFEVGKIASFQDIHKAMTLIGDFAITQFTYIMQPKTCRAININYLKEFPTEPLEVGKEIALCYADRTKRKSIRALLTPIIKKLVDIDLTIKKNLKDCKIGVVFASTLENQEAIKTFNRNLINGEDEPLDIPATEIDAINPITTNSQYLGQDLTDLREYYINEALTYIGIDNMNITKKERVNLDETNANNAIINISGDMVKDALNDWIDETNSLFNSGWSLKVKETKVLSLSEEDDESEEEENV